MLKLSNPAPFIQKDDDPEVTILDLSSPSEGLEKAAATGEIVEFVKNLKPKAGYTYLHINAMSAGEYFSSNRNADYFPEENLKKYYKTFETTPAYVYRGHVNKDPSRSYGKVIFSTYNDILHRIELIAECPDELVQDVNARIKVGDFPSTSMALKTPYDTCSICGNRASKRDEYCKHLKYELNRLYPDGRKVFAINDGPLTFFDISIVVRPADVTSSVLQKVASDGDVVGSAELAEQEGLRDRELFKSAEIVKWSELIKEIYSGVVDAASKDPLDLLKKTRDIPLDAINYIHSYDINEILNVFAALGISPSVEFLAELIARQTLGEGYEGIGGVVEELIHNIGDEQEVSGFDFREVPGINPDIQVALSPYVEGSSLLPSAVEKRASSGVGYANLGPHIEPLPHELTDSHAQVMAIKDSLPQYLKVLSSLGAAALLAKYFISKQIDKKISESNMSGLGNNVKIVLIKKASDYSVASALSKQSLHNALPSGYNSENSSEKSVDVNLANKVLKRVLKKTKTSAGNKLSQMLRVVGIGAKAVDNINQKGN